MTAILLSSEIAFRIFGERIAFDSFYFVYAYIILDIIAMLHRVRKGGDYKLTPFCGLVSMIAMIPVVIYGIIASKD